MDGFREGSGDPGKAFHGNGWWILRIYHWLADAGYERNWNGKTYPTGYRGQQPDHHTDCIWLVRYRRGSKRSRCNCLLRKATVYVAATRIAYKSCSENKRTGKKGMDLQWKKNSSGRGQWTESGDRTDHFGRCRLYGRDSQWWCGSS